MNPFRNPSIAERRTFWTKMIGVLTTLALCACFTATTFAYDDDDDDDDDDDGGKVSNVRAVFVGTNHNNTAANAPANEPANQVAMYRRATNGTLSLIGYFNTGGQGSGPSQRFAGDGLGSAHSVQLSQDGRFLFVVNAGSNNLSVFRVSRNRLQLVELQSTGNGSIDQSFPNSVTQHGDLVYVLNAARNGSITGFRLSNSGKLTPLSGSTRGLAANQGCMFPELRCPPDTLFNPTQISFTPDGKKLVVTIKDGPTAAAGVGRIPNFTGPTGPGRVLVFDVGHNGRPSATYRQSNLDNLGPFGFSFDLRGNLLIALFVAAPDLTAGAGSYRIRDNGTLAKITSPVLNGRLDTCWLENNGRYAYGANYGSGDISSYRIGNNGSLTLLAAIAAITDELPCVPGPMGCNGRNRQGSTPLDIRVSPNGRFLYNVLPGSGTVAAWRINSDGSLVDIGEFGGLPKTVDGDMAPEERFGPGGSPAGIDVL